MKQKVILILVGALLFLSSGCIGGEDSGGPGIDEEYEGNNTLLIKDLELQEDSLRPDQSTYLRLKVSNANIHDVKDFKAEVYNTGSLEVEKVGDCNFDLRNRIDLGELDTRECMWSVKAPGKDYLQNFDSKNIEMKLRISFRSKSSFYEEQPKIVFERSPEITEKSYETDAGDLKASLNFESPLPLFKKKVPLDINLKPGKGRPSNVEIEYQGAFDFSQCSRNVRINGSESRNIQCSIEPTGEIKIREERPILLRINYKYILSKSIDVEVTEPD